MTNQYSPEVLALRDRVIKGNEVLNIAWERICQLSNEGKNEQWREEQERWYQANNKLSGLCTELKAKGYDLCLYLDENGKKTRLCGESALGCRVCPSSYPYWTDELMALPGPKAKHLEHGQDQSDFLKTLGGKG